MVAVAEYLALAIELLVQRFSDADLEAFDRFRQSSFMGCFGENVQVVGLHAVVEEPEVLLRFGCGEGLFDQSVALVFAERG